MTGPRCSGPRPPRCALTELLADHTTLRVGGPAARWIEATTTEALVAAIADADAAGEPVLVLSGGSNVLVADAGFDGVVVHVATSGVSTDGGTFCEIDADAVGPTGDGASCGGILVEVQAGENWDDFVAWTVAQGYIGVEALSGIPGAVGSTPIQNVGAYGQEVAQTIWSVRTWDRRDRTYRTFANADCDFSYRHSRFKAEPGRYVVVSVTFQFLQGSLGAPIRFGELARRLEVEAGGRAPLVDVRDTVLALRRGKGMVLDADDHDTWSAGSFFTNPIVDAEVAALLPQDAPRFPTEDGRVKSSAAWLIEHAGFAKGHGTPPATLSSKHTLALTNRGGATAADIVALAREVRDGVRERFGVTLVPEPVFVGVELDPAP
ncbi:UDP-N-acetylmuramate dehydrogenase [Propioniciclava sinopodophylli]|uniref:UDP-N-acetylmuramate dehydrogenase n=1 Tax=Propioniciclava sinopodophylli TaxID=1837344 RepID=UPI0019D52615|nr:UDP-N-acetylmuramate dehydrogenase [Propioniciclava sinopodophylli]